MGLKFKLKQKTKISISGEEGVITGRAEYTDAPNQYYLHYKAADGRAVDGWFLEDQIESMAVTKKKKAAAVKT